MDLNYKRPTFSWQCAVGEKSRDTTTALAAVWKEMANRAQDIDRIQNRPKTDSRVQAQQEAIEGHFSAIRNISNKLLKGVPDDLQNQVTTWTKQWLKATANNNTRAASHLTRQAAEKGKNLESKARAERMTRWRNAIGATSSTPHTKTPTRLAYRWLKGLTGWSKSPLGDEASNKVIPEEPDEVDELGPGAGPEASRTYKGNADIQVRCGSARLTPLCDQAVVENECNGWVKLWLEGVETEKLDWDDIPQLPDITPDELRLAAASFPRDTGLGSDNISPRALLRLSDEAMEALATLLSKMERTGTWTKELNLVLVVLLAKPDGGFRPIGLLPTIIRVWMRARTAQIRAWENGTFSKELYGGKGMGAQRAAWVEAFSAEAAVLEQEEQAQALLDLTKAFELVDHSKLVQAAKRRGYPLALLRMSLAAYRLSRTIGVDGCFSRTVTASRGITAGSGFATTELRLLLMEVLEETHGAWGTSVRLTLYVDDLTISVRGAARFVKRRLAQAVDQVVNVFQERLALQVSVTKSAVVASSLKLAKAVARKAKSNILKVKRSAKLLGTGCGGGARRSTKVIKSRLHKVRAYSGRMWALRRHGANTQLMTRMAGTAAVTYGTDTQGVSNSLLQQQVSTIARMAAAEGGGKNPYKTLYALDGAAGTLDPTFAADALPLLHWATAVWEDWVPGAAMDSAYGQAKLKMTKGKTSWNKVAGPAAALWVTLVRAGWKWNSTTTFTDDEGEEWDARLDPPGTLAAAMNRTTRRRRFLQITSMHQGMLPARPDVGVGVHGRSDIIVDFANTLAPLIRGKVDTISSAPEFEKKHASALLSALANGQWPQTRKAAVPSWNISDNGCQLCNEAPGTLQHRRVCPFVMPTGGWAQIPENAQLAANTIGQHRLDTLRTTGLLALKLPAKQAKCYDTLQWGKRVPDDHGGRVTWYIDGSQLLPRRRALSSLGFGIVAVDDEGGLLAWAWGTPPKWCDSASAAEAWALCTVLRICTDQHRIVTDCLGLLKTAERGLAAAATAKMKLARTWTMIGHHLDGGLEGLCQDKRLTWMPAHQTATAIGKALKSTGAPITALDWRANHLVDGLAKKAAAIGATTEDEAKLVASAEHLVKHCAGQLAAATFRANNYTEHFLDEQGREKTRNKRDSQEIPKTGTRKLLPLSTSQPNNGEKEITMEDPVDIIEDSDSSSQPASKAARRREARAIAKKRDCTLREKALGQIVQANRLNAREAAIEHHRRKTVAASLATHDKPQGASEWSKFFDLNEEITSEESLGTEALTAKPQTQGEAGFDGQMRPAENPRDKAQCPDCGGRECNCAANSPHATSQLPHASRVTQVLTPFRPVRTVQPPTRSRPVRGSSGFTAADSKAALSSLLGTTSKASR